MGCRLHFTHRGARSRFRRRVRLLRRRLPRRCARIGRHAIPSSAACTLVAAQTLQTLLLGGWLLLRTPQTVVRVLHAWKASLLAGFMGAAASAGWFTAFAIEPAAHVRTLGLIELVFSYAVSLKLFREKLSRRELAGMGLLALGVVLITLKGASP
jgi:drug/metabolite transporter (DMT)-like permease